MRPADALPMIEAALRGGGVTSHHRIRHAANPAYLDANYGGILIVWDRPVGHGRRSPAISGSRRGASGGTISSVRRAGCRTARNGRGKTCAAWLARQNDRWTTSAA
jgi:hypothetical protein